MLVGLVERQIHCIITYLYKVMLLRLVLLTLPAAAVHLSVSKWQVTVPHNALPIFPVHWLWLFVSPARINYSNVPV